jgi:acyl carrier protein
MGVRAMNREQIKTEIVNIFSRQFEIENPGLNEDLRAVHGFDSIDAIELLSEIEKLLDSELTREEKKEAMKIRTINQILDYIELLAKTRNQAFSEVK